MVCLNIQLDAPLRFLDLMFYIYPFAHKVSNYPSNWPGLCLFCCYQYSLSEFIWAFLFHKFPILPRTPSRLYGAPPSPVSLEHNYMMFIVGYDHDVSNVGYDHGVSNVG